jgi:hypothetical protein
MQVLPLDMYLKVLSQDVNFIVATMLKQPKHCGNLTPELSPSVRTDITEHFRWRRDKPEASSSAVVPSMQTS